MKGKERINCPICNGHNSIIISSRGRDYITTFTSICKNCGFLYQNPRWTKERIGKFYKKKYDYLYRSGFKAAKMSLSEYENYKYGFAPVYQRIKNHVNKFKKPSILDIGSGDGTNLTYLGTVINTTELFAIEPSLIAQKQLKSKNISLITNDVDDNWTENFIDKFDIIILRHVLEHVHFPNQLLQKIRKCLKPDGILYIAVPDSYNIGPDWLTRGFFRIVHNYYFSYKSLSNILLINGFNIVEHKQGDTFHNHELFTISVKTNPTPLVVNENEYNNQMSYLGPLIESEETSVSCIKSFGTFLLRHILTIKNTIFRH